MWHNFIDGMSCQLICELSFPTLFPRGNLLIFVFLVRNSLPSIRIISPEPRPLYVHLLDIHTCSLGGEGQGTFAYPPPLFTSPSPSPLTCGWWLQLQCLQSAINAAANRFRAPRPLEMLMFRTSLSLSLACRGRFGLVWASFPQRS